MSSPKFTRVMNLSVYDYFEDDKVALTGTIQELTELTGLTRKQLYSRNRKDLNPRIENTGRKVKQEVEQTNGMKLKKLKENKIMPNELHNTKGKMVKVWISNAEILERTLLQMHRNYHEILTTTKTYDDGKAMMLPYMDEIDDVMRKWSLASEVKEWQMVEESLMGEKIT